MSKRIAVLVSGGGTNLQALIDAQSRGELGGGEIVAVISSKAGAYALERAKNAGIEGFVLPRKEFASNQAMTVALVDLLKKLDIDLVVLAGCMIIFTQELVDAYPNAIMNVHPALIPSFCGQGYYGLRVHEEALRYGVKVSGATVHFVSAECDGGPIIAQRAVEVRHDDTPEMLQKRIMEQAEWILLPEAVKLSGATVHFVTAECDGGPIIAQEAVPVLPGDTPEVLQKRIMEQAEWKILPEAVSLFCQGRIKVDGRTVIIQ